MMLPTPLYENMPKLWLVMGFLFVAYGLFLGLHIPDALVSIIMGFICSVYGIGIAAVRLRYRRNRPEHGDLEATAA